MRPNVARRRITFESANGELPKRSFFYLRQDPRVSAGAAARFVMVSMRQFCIAAAFVSIVCLLPMSEEKFKYVYLPLVVFLACPAIFRALEIPPVFIVVPVFFVVYWVCTGEYPNSPPDIATLGFGLIGLQVVVPLTVIIGSARSKRWTAFTAITVLVTAILSIVDDQPHESAILQAIILLGLVAFSVFLIRSYAGRLAASPKVSVESAMRLIELSRWPWERRRASGVPRCGWWKCAVTSVLGIVVANAFLRSTAGESIIIGSGNGLDLYQTLSLGAAILGLFCVLFIRCSLIVGYWRAIEGLLESTILWLVDDHPVPSAAGIYTAARFDIGKFPFRRTLTLVLLVLGTSSLVIQRPSLGLAQFRATLRQGDLMESVLHTLDLVFEAGGILSVCVLIICAPWFAHFLRLARLPNSDD